MADSVVLKPFYDRATEAEERLSKLEAAINTKKDAEIDNKEKFITEIQAKLKEQESEIKEAVMTIKKITSEKEKLEYRIIHLMRAVRETEEGKSGS